MLDRSQPANLFSEHPLEADELAGAADAAVERSAASPTADPVEAQRDASPSTAPPRARPRRPRPNGGGRRGAVRSKPPVRARKRRLELPAAPPRGRGWRRARWVAPVVPLLLVIPVAGPAGRPHRATRTSHAAPTSPLVTDPASLPPQATRARIVSPAAPGAHRRTHEHRGAAAGQLPRTPHANPVAPADATRESSAPAPPPERTLPLAAAARPQPALAAPATHAANPVANPASPPAAANSGSPPQKERGEGDEFGFER